MAMSSHSRPSVGFDTGWETPPDILAALGVFDDDPCQENSIEGFLRPWRGRVWLNPPYDRDMQLWLGKLADHGNGIALIFARTETKVFVREVWKRADGLLFLHGRLHFYRRGQRAHGNAGAPSVLVAYGNDNVLALRSCNLRGTLVTGWDIRV